MKKILTFIFSLLLTNPLWAADNAVVVTAGTGLTLRSRDVGVGVQSLQQILGDTSGNALATAPGTPNASFALPVQGVSGGTAVPISGAITITSGTTVVTQATGTNLHAVLDTTSTTAVTQATGTNLHMVADSGTITTVSTVTNLAQMNGVALLMGNGVTGTGSQRVTIASDNTAFSVNSTLSAETTKVIGTVRNLGNAGAITDFAGQNAAAPANSWLVGCEFTTSPTTITTGNASPLSCANDNSLRVTIVAGAGSGGTAIADNAAFTLGTTNETPIGCYNGSATTTAAHVGIVSCTTAGSVHTTVDNANANGQATAANSSPVVAPVLTVAGAAVVKGGVPVVNGGSNYLEVAASQTATVLQTSTGATGDYLSHCVIYPATTGAGLVTVFDNTNSAANNVIQFVSGTLSNLAPIAVPVGANSVNGAWKVTTGANVAVVCFGKFS